MEKEYTLNELKDKLTGKEKNFCHEYCVDWNAARSARDAGYSVKTARETGYENLTKPHIKQYIAFIKTDYEALCGISKTKQIKEIQKIAYSSIAHMHNTWVEQKEFESLTDHQKESIESIESKIEFRSVDGLNIEVKYIKVKLYSKLSALSEINKMMGYHEAEKVNMELGINTLKVIKASESDSGSSNK